jgi:uncharacterized protein YegP (UPF0339 family)
MAKSAEFDYYQNKGGEWRWGIRAKNGQLLANGGKGKLASMANVLRSLKAVRKAVAKAGDPEEVEGR